jgi:hypothetical protein
LVVRDVAILHVLWHSNSSDLIFYIEGCANWGFQHPFGGREGANDIAWLRDRIIAFSIPMESLRLVHPMARDLILKVLLTRTLDGFVNVRYFSV